MYANRNIKGITAALSSAVCLLGGISTSGANGAASASHSAASSAGAVASAHIAQFSTNSPAMIAAEAIAVRYWNMPVCGGQAVTVEWGSLAPMINATSNWWNPVAAYGNAAANYQCTIILNKAQGFDWPKFCSVMVHEFGHLTGHEHASDLSSVMYPVYQRPVPECKGNHSGATARAASSSHRHYVRRAHSRYRRH